MGKPEVEHNLSKVFFFTKKKLLELAVSDGQEREIFRDKEVKGLVLRVSRTGEKVFYYEYRRGRGRGASKAWVKIGAFDKEISLTVARERALQRAGEVALGGDPAREIAEDKRVKRFSEAASLYLAEYIAVKRKESTQQGYEQIFRADLLPTFGAFKLTEISKRRIERFHAGKKDTPYQANRCLAVLSSFFGWCIRQGFTEENPCKGVEKFQEKRKQDFLSSDEVLAILHSLDEMSARWEQRNESQTRRTKGTEQDTITPESAALIRLFLYTGKRMHEILSLKWEYLDLQAQRMALPDSKVGQKVYNLPRAAVEVFEALPRLGEYVFPAGTKNSKKPYRTNYKNAWRAVLIHTFGATNWRPYDCRHAVASMMVNEGVPLPLIGKVLGHSEARTTERYAHVSRDISAVALDSTLDKLLNKRKA